MVCNHPLMDVRLVLESRSGLYPQCFIINYGGCECANIKDEPIAVKESSEKIKILYIHYIH